MDESLRFVFWDKCQFVQQKRKRKKNLVCKTTSTTLVSQSEIHVCMCVRVRFANKTWFLLGWETTTGLTHKCCVRENSKRLLQNRNCLWTKVGSCLGVAQTETFRVQTRCVHNYFGGLLQIGHSSNGLWCKYFVTVCLIWIGIFVFFFSVFDSYSLFGFGLDTMMIGCGWHTHGIKTNVVDICIWSKQRIKKTIKKREQNENTRWM